MMIAISFLDAAIPNYNGATDADWAIALDDLNSNKLFFESTMPLFGPLNPGYVVMRLDATAGVEYNVTVRLIEQTRQQGYSITTNDSNVVTLRSPSTSAYKEIMIVDRPFRLDQLKLELSIATAHEQAVITNAKTLLRTSYIFFCYINPTDDQMCHAMLEPRFESEGHFNQEDLSHRTLVRCVCVPTSLFHFKHIHILIVCVAVWCATFWRAARAKNELLTTANAAPEVQHLLIMCTARNARYIYTITFRVGCATPDFCPAESIIDVELLKGVDRLETVGAPIRFAAANLYDPICNEMKCINGNVYGSREKSY